VRVQLGVEQAHDFCRCAAGVNDRLGDLLGRGERPADEHAGPRGLERRKLVRVAEAVFVQLDVEQLCQPSGGVGRLQAGGQHNRFEALLVARPVRIGVVQDQVVRGRVFADGGDAAADVANAVALARGGEVAAVFLVEGALVHDEDAALDLASQPLLGEHGFFGGVHAADGRAEGVLLVARADALQPGNGARALPIRRAHDHAFGGAGAAG